MQAEPDAAGKMVKCPGCGAKIKIPEDPHATSTISTGETGDAPPTPSLPKPSGVEIPKPTGVGSASASAPSIINKPLPEPLNTLPSGAAPDYTSRLHSALARGDSTTTC